jgi:Tol biopolymer transport system component
VRTDGSGTERLTTGEFNEVAQDWSPDGKTLVFYEGNPTGGYDLWFEELKRLVPARK